MRYHFIAIGGAAMHNLAIALHLKKNMITGSDDEIFEPSRSHLEMHGLLPEKPGWFAEKITKNIDAVILGMHALKENPELLKALQLGLRIYSFPEFLYEQTKNKKRVVIGGSHGKTTITSMIMHVLKQNNKVFDYLVGAQIEGFDAMAGIFDNSEIAVFEGDEYLSSSIDLRPKFHLYNPHIAVISGISWDHINVFPTFKDYLKQFEIFIEKIQQGGILIYNADDMNISNIVKSVHRDIKFIPYHEHDYIIENNKTWLITEGTKIPFQIFGKHNLQNINAAFLVCKELGVSNSEFYEAIATFKGAKKRLQLLAENEQTTLFSDFAHSPSKLRATIEAVKNQFPKRTLIACMELHTFSSLTEDFLTEYKDSMIAADIKLIYFNPDTIKHKRLKDLDPAIIKETFNDNDLIVFTKKNELLKSILSYNWIDTNILLMSSGNFGGLDYQELIKGIK